MNTQEFANSIRTKFADGVSSDGRAYKDIPDNELTQKIVTKYPQYKSQISDYQETQPTGIMGKIGQGISEGASALMKPYQELPGKVASDISTGADTIGKGGAVNAVKGIAQSGLRTSGDFAGAIFSPIGTAVGGALEKTGIQSHIIQPIAQAIVDKSGITDIKGVQDWVTAHPNAAEDFGRLMNLGMAKGEKGNIEPSTALPRTMEQVKTGARALDTGLAKVEKTAGQIKSIAQIPVDKFSNVVKSIIPEKSTVRATLTNTDPNIFKRIEDPIHAESVKNYLSSLDEGRSPNMDLAHTIGNKINELEQKAGDNFHTQVDNYAKDNQYHAWSGQSVEGKILPYGKEGTSKMGIFDDKIDVGSKVGDIEKAVTDFGKGNDLHWEQQKTADGKLAGYELTKGRYSPFTSTEIRNVNNMIDDIRSAKAINVDELLALDKKLGQYYSLVDDSAGARPYHSLVMKIKAKSEGLIQDALPPEMQDAYKQYARVQNMRSDFGNKIVDSKGNIQNGAESFLSNLMGKNKTEMQRKANSYSQDLGFDPVKEAQAISDAKKLHLTEAPSGGRVSDILKSTLFGGGGAAMGSAIAGPAGTVIGAGVGAAVGRRMTSPRLAGEKAISETLQGQKDTANIQTNQNKASIDTTIPQTQLKSNVSDVAKAVKKKIAEIPNKQGGLVKNPLASVTKLADLASEAKKYRSAEEFVKAQPKLFRYGSELDLTRGKNKGISFTKTAQDAMDYQYSVGGKIRPGGKLDSAMLDSSAKILKEKDIPSGLLDSTEQDYNSLIKYARKNKYDAVEIGNIAGENEIRVLNPDKLITKSQLTEIWNKANNK